MFFDKDYIAMICSTEILRDESHDTTAEDTIGWIDEQGFRFDFEERAAILEYDGGLAREEADAQAMKEIVQRIKDAERIRRIVETTH